MFGVQYKPNMYTKRYIESLIKHMIVKSNCGNLNQVTKLFVSQ